MRPSALGISGLLCHRVLKKPLYLFDRASLVAQVVKNLPAMEETQISFPDQEDHPAWARVSVRARTGLRLEPRAATRLPIPLRSRESLGSPRGEAALRREGGKEVGVGTDPGWRAASQAETVPSPLSFHASPTRV